MKQILGLALGLLLLIGVTSVAAKGDNMVRITGDTLDQPVEVKNNPCILSAFTDSSLEDLTTMTDRPPTKLGASFLITRYMQVGTNTYQPLDHVRYYLDPAGGLGYVRYLGQLIDNSSTPYDGYWFHPTAPTDAIIKLLIGQPTPDTPDQAVISSGSPPHDITISHDRCTLIALAAGNLEDPAFPVRGTPTVEGSGYLITRYRDGQPYDQVRLYHDPRGGRAFVHNLGRVDGGASASAGRWFRPSLLSQSVIDGLLNPSGYTGNP